MTDQGELFAQALKRPKNYDSLDSYQQWQIDRDLGILDWDGSCPHYPQSLCDNCMKIYERKFGK